TGAVGTAAYARHQAMPWRFGGWLTLGAAPAAAAGALVNGVVPATALWLFLAVVTAGSGAFNLWARPRESRDLPAPAAVAVGAAGSSHAAIDLRPVLGARSRTRAADRAEPAAGGPPHRRADPRPAPGSSRRPAACASGPAAGTGSCPTARRLLRRAARTRAPP